MTDDEELTVKLSLGQWRTVTTLIEGGIYREVQPILASVYGQVNAQISTIVNREAAEAIQEYLRETGTVVVPESPASAPTNAGTEEAGEPQAPPSLH